MRCLTHDDGDPPVFDGTLFSPPWDLPANIDFWLDERRAPWIVNIDLDYFFCEADEGFEPMFSDNYLEAFGKGLKEAMDRGVVSVITLCLTPDSFTPGWDATEALATRILDMLESQFSLPSS